MEYLLARGCTICPKEVDAFAFEPAVSQSLGNVLGRPKHMSARFFIKFCQRRGMVGGNDQHMPWINGLNIHEGTAQVIPANDT